MRILPKVQVRSVLPSAGVDIDSGLHWDRAPIAAEAPGRGISGDYQAMHSSLRKRGGRDGPFGPPPARIRTEELIRVRPRVEDDWRLLASADTTSLPLVHRRIRCHAFPALRPARVRFERHFPWSIPFPPRTPQPPSGPALFARLFGTMQSFSPGRSRKCTGHL